MQKPGACLIEAGSILCGMGDDGAFRIERDAALLVRDGKLVEIGDARTLAAKHPDLPRFGSPGHIAMPGLINSHHHFGVTPLMLGVPFAPLELWLPQFRGMRQVPTRLDTLYAAIEMLESGTTAVHHIHGGMSGSPEHWQEVSNDILNAYGEIGMRAGYSFMIRDRNVLAYDDDAQVVAGLPPEVRDWISPQLRSANVPVRELMEFVRGFHTEWAERNPDNVRINVAPANLHWCSDEALSEIFGTAQAIDAQVHMHLLETKRQAEFAMRTHGHSAIAHLAHLGCLNPNLTLGHGNWASRSDLELLAQHRCGICHNASSGLRLGSGIAPVNLMRQAGVKVALGIDQSNFQDDRDMLAEMKLVWALHRETGLFNECSSAAQVLQMASEHGAQSIGFGGETGRLEVGMAADIVLLKADDIGRPHIDARAPLAAAVLHRARQKSVDQVFVGGRLVVDGGRVVSIDRDAVLAELGAVLAAPHSDAELHARAMVDKLVPALAAHHRQHTPDTYRAYRYNLADS